MIGLLGLLALLPAVGPRERRIVLFHLVGLLALEAGLALYHVGVEQHWQPWLPGPTACTGGVGGISLDDLSAALSRPAGPSCDTPALVIGGLSIAGLNFILASALTGLALVAGLKRDWWRT